MKTSFWTLISQNRIEIPIIQRDYAQGRIEQGRIARGFISKIKNKLVANEKLNLDFVYGKIENNTLIPLDGQQRLTTLFLLHWFLVTKENEARLNDEIKTILYNFSYETRPSSQDFCRKLVNEGVIKYESQEIISETIENQKWFSLSWKSDPTIKAILNMLNIIQEMFVEIDTKLFDSLISSECVITFNYLPLDKFKLTDELYIKMNSRGKPLSEFENFKANFSILLRETEKSKLDNDWYDIFWKLECGKDNLEIKNIDNQFYNFFSNITLNFYVEENDIDKTFIDSFYLFNEYEQVYKYLINPINQIQTILDALQTYIDDAYYFKDFIKSTNITYWERARFYALSKFLIINGEINQRTKTSYENWMRVCCNLINNTLIQSPTDFYTVIRSINQLSLGIYDIYNHILNTEYVSGFIKNQQEEERIKAELILKSNTNWEKEIIKIEKNTYFDGQIGFILNYSKVNGNYDLNQFVFYANKLDTLFTIYKERKNYLFQRALFACGYYIENIGNSKTFCSFETGLRAKNDNWRKVFNDDKKTIVLKHLLDKIKLETIELDLNGIINGYIEKDWKSVFIHNVRILPYCCNYQIKKNGDKVYLSRSTANNWKRKGELYTFDFYTTHIENKSIPPFTNCGYFETVDEPRMFMNGWNIKADNFVLDIFYDEGFKLSFFNWNSNEYSNEIKSVLETLNFEYKNSRFEMKTVLKDKEDFYIFLNSICNAFKLFAENTL
jgi:hypothetical protein